MKNIQRLISDVISEELYPKLVEQIQKDFVLANINFNIPVKVDSLSLVKLLQEKIYVLILEKFDQYLNLLYVIDVPEKSFKEIEVTDVVEIAEQVSYLILKREFQKVKLKAKYR